MKVRTRESQLPVVGKNCATHERIGEVCDHMRADPEHYKDFQFYPCMPYAHKHVNAVTEAGILEDLRSFLPEEGALNAMLKSGMSLVKKDVEDIGQLLLLIDAEMTMVKGLQTPAIFLQNLVWDLLFGLGLKEAYRIFVNYMKNKYSAEPGIITMNMPKLLDVLVLEGLELENPVCFRISTKKIWMCGEIDAYESAIATQKFRSVAMPVFASGAISPKEALEHVCKQGKIESIVFGASSHGNIRQTKQLIDQFSSAE